MAPYPLSREEALEYDRLMAEADADARQREEADYQRRRHEAKQAEENRRSKEREKQRADLAKAQADWDERFDARFFTHLNSAIAENNGVTDEVIGTMSRDDHEEMVAHVAKAVSDLRAEFATQLAELREGQATAKDDWNARFDAATEARGRAAADLSNGLNNAFGQACQQIEQVRTEVADAEARVLAH